MSNFIEERELGFKVEVPDGWRYKKLQTGYIFGHPQKAGLLMLLFHYNHTIEDLKNDMEAGFYDDSGFNLQVEGEIKEINDSTVLAHYKGTTQGMAARGYSVGRLSPYGGGVLVAAIANPDHFSDDYMDFVDDMAQYIEFYEPEVSSVSIEWENFLKNKILDNNDGKSQRARKIRYYLMDNGTFSLEQNTAESLKESIQRGDTGGANRTGQWEVVDVMDQPILSIKFFDGTEKQYSLAYEDGEIFLNNEHWEMYDQSPE